MVLGAHIKRLLPFLLLLTINPSHAQSINEDARELDSEHRRGVALAREGRHNEALDVLMALSRKYPGNYPVERDIVVITAWKGDCRATVRRHWLIRDYPDPEPFYVIPVSECLITVGRAHEAIALLEAAQKRWPSDNSLASAHATAVARRDAQYLHALGFEVSTNDSDQGRREWLWGARLTRKLADRAHVYARYSISRSGFEELQQGKQNRLGVGVEYEFPVNLIVTQEFSGDIHRDGQGGSLTSVVFLPNDLWRFGAAYIRFAEDIPLRAKAQLTEADHTNVFADFHTKDYRWSWAGSTSRYDFSDTNQRRNLFTTVAYAYELEPRREQRVFLEYFQSRNTLDAAAYFNPPRDKSVSVVHRTDFVLNTRFRRHVDHLFLSVGTYDQQGFGSHGIWGIRYEQDYDFTDRVALSAGAGYARRVYDGAGEFQTSLNVSLRWLF